jgi:formylglycine-generating enzyme required for sulfatase activity
MLSKHSDIPVRISVNLIALILTAAPNVSAASHQSTRSLTVRGVTFHFVRIFAGQFQMGSETGDSDEKPVHPVQIRHSFDMGRTEITVAQFRAFTEATGYKTDAERRGWAWLCPELDIAGPDRGLHWRKPGFPQSDNHPVVAISWNDAVAFCRWLARETGEQIRLPSEAEWEYACRAESPGDFAGDPDQMGWYDDNSNGATHPVGRKKPNAWGLYDMHGNAWEWCRDVWHYNYNAAPCDGSARINDDSLPDVASRRLLRGGAWCRPVGELRCSYRYRGTTLFRNCGTGFRIVRGVNKTRGDKDTSLHKELGSRDRVRNAALPEEHGRLWAVARQPAFTLYIDGVTFQFVRIAAGDFLMGSERDDFEKPAHRVKINYGFDIGKTEVTVRQFRAFVDATEYLSDAEKERWAWTRSAGKDWHPELGICWRDPGFEQTDDHPVTCVSWHDAVAFCRWLSRQAGEQIRLPSEAEWEYVCRAGSNGDYSGELNEMGWHRYNSGHRTHPVAQKRPNAWGLYDMHGNTWEWCQDMWHDYRHAPTDGSASVNADYFSPMLRGGSFINPPWWLRSACRMPNDPGCRYSYNQGFRIVRSLTRSKSPRSAPKQAR